MEVAEDRIPGAARGDTEDTAVYAHPEQNAATVERIVETRDQIGFYKHPQETVGMEGQKVRQSSISGTPMMYCCEIKKKFVIGGYGFFHTLLNTKQPKLDPTIVEQLPVRPVALMLGDTLTMIERKETIRSAYDE